MTSPSVGSALALAVEVERLRIARLVQNSATYDGDPFVRAQLERLAERIRLDNLPERPFVGPESWVEVTVLGVPGGD